MSVLYAGAALADGRSPALRMPVSVLVADGIVTQIRDGDPGPAPPDGFVIDNDVARLLATNGVTLVSTLSVMHSWLTFASTTSIERFAASEGRARIAERLETAQESIRNARRAGVAIAAGSDFGGGSVRAGHLAWEVQALVAAGPAHFTLVHGDPLTDPAALWRVWRVV